MSVYRMTLRFNLEDAEERSAAESLQRLKRGDCNRFVVSAVLAHIRAENANAVDPTLLDSIRRIFRQASIPKPPTTGVITSIWRTFRRTPSQAAQKRIW